jgi:hypothetical protein
MRENIPTLSLLDVVPRVSRGISARDARNLKYKHDTVEHAMHDLEAGGLIAPYRGGVTLVPCLPFGRCILEDDVRGLEDSDRQRVRSVFPDRLQ